MGYLTFFMPLNLTVDCVKSLINIIVSNPTKPSCNKCKYNLINVAALLIFAKSREIPLDRLYLNKNVSLKEKLKKQFKYALVFFFF